MGWLIDKIKSVVAVKPTETWVSPLQTIVLPNTADVIFDAGDTIGTVGEFEIPKSGTLEFAKLNDRADLGTQFNIVLFSAPLVSAPASDAAFALADTDLLNELYTLEFTVFKDRINGQISYLDHIGLVYKLPPVEKGSKKAKVYYLAYAPAAQTHVLGSEHTFLVKVHPDEPQDD